MGTEWAQGFVAMPLIITFKSQLGPLQHMIMYQWPILEDDPSLSQTLRGRPVLGYRQPPPHLMQTLTTTTTNTPHNKMTNTGTRSCQICPYIHSGKTIWTQQCELHHQGLVLLNIYQGNIFHCVPMMPPPPPAIYLGQTGLSLSKRTQMDTNHTYKMAPLRNQWENSLTLWGWLYINKKASITASTWKGWTGIHM